MPADARFPLISQDATVRGGRPYFTGTRIGVADVLEWLAGGMSEADLLRDFPQLTAEMLHAARRFSGDKGAWAQ